MAPVPHPSPPTAPPRRPVFLRSLCAMALLGLALATSAFAQEVSKEYRIKAGFLYNFSKFVQWPADRFADDTSPIVIAVLGSDPFGEELDKIVKGRAVEDRPIVIRRIRSAADIPAAHIVFIGADSDPLPPSLLGSPGVLTVGEGAGFSASGGVITFTVVSDRVRFEINQTAADQAGLKLSGQLLKLATAVRKSP